MLAALETAKTWADVTATIDHEHNALQTANAKFAENLWRYGVRMAIAERDGHELYLAGRELLAAHIDIIVKTVTDVTEKHERSVELLRHVRDTMMENVGRIAVSDCPLPAYVRLVAFKAALSFVGTGVHGTEWDGEEAA